MRSSLLMVLSLLCPATLAAQYQVAVLAGSAASRGNARSDIGPDHPELRPDNATAVAVAVRRWSGRWRADAVVRRTTADLSEIGPGTALVTRGALEAWGGGVLIGRRLTGSARRASLAALLGAGVDRWRFVGIDGASRWRGAGWGALEADLPAGGRWLALIRGDVAVGPSLFDAGELPSEFRATPAWRYGISLGVARAW